MSRTRSAKTAHLPRYMHERHGAFFFMRGKLMIKLGHTLADAMVEYGKYLGASSTTGGITIHELIDRAMPSILKGREAQGLSDKTVENYKGAARLMKRKVFPLNGPAKDVTTKYLMIARKQFLEEGEQGQYSNWVTVFRGVCEYGMLYDHLDVNPCPRCPELETFKTKARKRHVTHEEYLRIYHAEHDQQALVQIVMEFCYRTGQRISDVLGVTENDIDDARNGGIFVDQGKTEAKLIIEWQDEVYEEMGEPNLFREAVERAKQWSGWFDKVQPLRKGPRLLFADPKRPGRPLPYETVRKAFAAAVAASGVTNAEGTRLHDIRAKAAQDTCDAENAKGGDGEKKASGLLGHASLRMTLKHYLRLHHHQAKRVQGPTGRIVKAAA